MLMLMLTCKQLVLIGISYAIIGLFPQISSTSVLSLFTDCMRSATGERRLQVGQLLCVAGNRTRSPDDSKRPEGERQRPAAETLHCVLM